MPKVMFKIPSYEEISTTIYYLVKDKKDKYQNNIFIELPKELIDKIVCNELKTVKEEIVKNIKEYHNILKLEEVKSEIEKIWQPLNDLFFDNLKKITEFDFPFDNVIVYITEIVRGMYSPKNNVFINPIKNKTSYVISEEIFHLHYWNIFKKVVKNVEIPWRLNKEVWEISEVIPEFILTDDKFVSFGWGKDLHRNYPFIEKWKEKLLPVWKSKKNFKEFIINIHNDLV